VTAGEIRKAALDFLQSDRLSLALVSPLKSDKPLRKVLLGGERLA
jgi:hypothetical protein